MRNTSPILSRARNNLWELHKRILASRDFPLRFNHEALELLIDEKDRDVLTRATRIAGDTIPAFTTLYTTLPTYLGKVRLGIGYKENYFKHVIPDYSMKRLAKGAARGADVIDFVDWYAERVREVSIANHVLFNLWEQCANVQTVRFFFPGFLALATDPEDADMRNRILTIQQPASIPKFSALFRSLCKQATDIVGRMQLAPERENEGLTYVVDVAAASAFTVANPEDPDPANAEEIFPLWTKTF